MDSTATLSWSVMLVGAAFLIVLMLVVVGSVLALMVAKSRRRVNGSAGHPDVAECPACGFVSPAKSTVGSQTGACPQCNGTT